MEATTTFDEKVERFAELVLTARRTEIRRLYSDSQADAELVQVKPRRAYTLVDVGPAHNMSGRYMIENATGIIYGIKGYGKVHKGHRYGTLDTISERHWGIHNDGTKVTA